MKFFGLDKEKWTAIFLSYLLSLLSLNISVNAICAGIFGAGVTFDTMIVQGIFYVLLIGMIASNGLKITSKIVAFVVFFVAAGVVAVLIEPATKEFIFGPYDIPIVQRNTTCFAMYCLTGFLAVSYIDDTEYFMEVFEKMCFITLFLSFICYGFSVIKKTSLQYMVFSYNMLLHVTFLAVKCLDKFDMKKLIFAGTGLFIIFIAGCRGALVCCLFSILIYLLFVRTNAVNKVLIVALMVSMALIMFFNFDEFMIRVGEILERFDISSRTVSLITSGEFFEDSGRTLIHEKIMDNLNLFGHGIFSDRLLTGGSYAHHLLYELIYEFGIIFGGIIFILVCRTIVRGFLNSKDKNRIMICALLSSGFTKLFFSGSFLNQEPSLYVLLGLCILISEKSRKEIRKS